MAAGAIAPGYVDTRSIEDVTPNDLRGFKQCHFFAGIGGWAYALRLAGWPDDRPVWTGSCPCQPFSAAGKGGGFDDKRHLWPAWHWLIAQCRPGVVFGEQVASKDGLAWLDLVLTDLEVEGYAAGAFDLCAAGVGAPHIRQRLWLVADAEAGRRGARRRGIEAGEHGADVVGCSPGGMADAGRQGRGQVGADVRGGRKRGSPQGVDERPVHGSAWDLADTSAPGLPVRERAQLSGTQQLDEGRAAEQLRRAPWADADWLPCRDGKARPVEPGILPLLPHGVSGRVAVGSAIQPPAATLSDEEAAHAFSRALVLRGAGNAIVPQVAAEVIKAYLSHETDN